MEFKVEKEIWKDIPNYESLYQVSNLGNVRSLDRYIKYSDGRVYKYKGKNLTPISKPNGYLTVALSINSKVEKVAIHQLVAMAFLGHKRCGFKVVVDHIDGNIKNNTLSNIQLLSNRQNVVKGLKSRGGGTSKYVGVFFDKNAKKFRASITVNGVQKMLGTFESEYAAHLMYEKKLKEALENEN